MLIYFFIAFVLFVLGFLDRRVSDSLRAYFLIFAFLLLVCFDGLRWESGTDWDNYYKMFSMIESGEDERFELGYLALNRIIYYLTGNYSIFLVIHALILYGCLFIFLWKFSDSPLLSVFLFFVMFLPYQGMNRQFLSIALCLISFKYLVEGNTRTFVLIIIAATFFHLSAVIFLIALVLTKNYSFQTYLYVLIGVVVLGLFGVVKLITDFGLNMLAGHVAYLLDFYSSKDTESAKGIGLLLAYVRRLLWILPLLYKMSRGESEMPRHIVIAFNLYFFGSLIYILFNGTILQIFVSRALLYFNVFECLLIPYIIFNFGSNWIRFVIYNIVFFYGIANMYKGIKAYDIGEQNPFLPYKSVYYNQSISRSGQ